MKSPKPQKMVAPAAPPPPPTIDEAARASEEADKLRRRRGRLATVFAGQRGQGPLALARAAISQKQLTGQ